MLAPALAPKRTSMARPAPFALERGLLCFDRAWTHAKSFCADDDRFGGDTRGVGGGRLHRPTLRWAGRKVAVGAVVRVSLAKIRGGGVWSANGREFATTKLVHVLLHRRACALQRPNFGWKCPDNITRVERSRDLNPRVFVLQNDLRRDSANGRPFFGRRISGERRERAPTPREDACGLCALGRRLRTLPPMDVSTLQH